MVPALVRPMLATLGELPPSTEDDKYGYETKWDGVRAVLYVDQTHVRVMTRNDLDVTVAYPELVPLGRTLAASAVLDGEIVAYDAAGRVSFGALQDRMHVRNPAQVRRLAEQVPVTYCVFDLLYLDGRDTTGLGYEQRRTLLEALDLEGPHWTTPPYVRGGGAEALRSARELGVEGIMAKRLRSTYEPGRRSKAWVKVKNTRTQEVVLAGWKPGKGNRSGTIGSLLLGIPGPHGLEYVGQVGTGFTRTALDALARKLNALQRRTTALTGELPAADRRQAHWVTPSLVGEVEFSEWTRDGRLRHPRWRGLRPDKAPADVRRE
jgi:bifunctional non-homologous end joining protein LigD